MYSSVCPLYPAVLSCVSHVPLCVSLCVLHGPHVCLMPSVTLMYTPCAQGVPVILLCTHMYTLLCPHVPHVPCPVLIHVSHMHSCVSVCTPCVSTLCSATRVGCEWDTVDKTPKTPKLWQVH